MIEAVVAGAGAGVALLATVGTGSGRRVEAEPDDHVLALGVAGLLR